METSDPRFADNALLFCLKHPTPGRVKTRLAAAVGPERACSMYARWITEILTLLQPLRSDVRLIAFYSGAEAATFQPWIPLADQWLAQPEGTLGDRLDAGFHAAFEYSNRVCAIGADCLDISVDLIEDSFARLKDWNVVLGPAEDGGYYLIGADRSLPGLFAEIRWSQPETLADQIRNCRQNGWSYTMLPKRSDIDTWEDWENHCARLGISPT